MRTAPTSLCLCHVHLPLYKMGVQLSYRPVTAGIPSLISLVSRPSTDLVFRSTPPRQPNMLRTTSRIFCSRQRLSSPSTRLISSVSSGQSSLSAVEASGRALHPSLSDKEHSFYSFPHVAVVGASENKQKWGSKVKLAPSFSAATVNR